MCFLSEWEALDEVGRAPSRSGICRFTLCPHGRNSCPPLGCPNSSSFTVQSSFHLPVTSTAELIVLSAEPRGMAPCLFLCSGSHRRSCGEPTPHAVATALSTALGTQQDTGNPLTDTPVHTALRTFRLLQIISPHVLAAAGALGVRVTRQVQSGIQKTHSLFQQKEFHTGNWLNLH